MGSRQASPRWPGRRHGVAVTLVCGAVLAALATEATASSRTLMLDQRRSHSQLEDAADAVRTACAGNTRVRVIVKSRAGSFRTRVDCAQAITERLVAAAGHHRRAGRRAARVVELQRNIPSTPGLSYERHALVWSLAAGNPQTCRRAGDRHEIRSMIDIGRRSSGESAERWTLIEAVLIAGACPGRLPVLLQNVRRVGEPEAAASVRQTIRRASA